MARLSSAPTVANTPHDLASVELSQLLSRLQQSVLHPTPERERRLRTSEYERARIEANLAYARSVLHKLEQDALSKGPGRRMETQGALTAQREALETLADRLADLRKMAADDDEDDDDSSDGEDLLGDIIPTPSESMDSASVDTREEDSDGESPARSIPPALAIPTPTRQSASASPSQARASPPVTAEHPTQTTQTLRGRSSAPSPSPSSHTTARATLFANRRKPAPPETSTATAEAILDHQRGEQDALSESILKMAGALRASAQKFSTTLEADKEVVGRAGDGMNKTERGMEAARGRMGALRKMTEGKGWWGRMILYAWVYGLMLTLVLLVFVMPKLRF